MSERLPRGKAMVNTTTKHGKVVSRYLVMRIGPEHGISISNQMGGRYLYLCRYLLRSRVPRLSTPIATLPT